jgi:hypothetical protein
MGWNGREPGICKRYLQTHTYAYSQITLNLGHKLTMPGDIKEEIGKNR